MRRAYSNRSLTLSVSASSNRVTSRQSRVYARARAPVTVAARIESFERRTLVWKLEMIERARAIERRSQAISRARELERGVGDRGRRRRHVGVGHVDVGGWCARAWGHLPGDARREVRFDAVRRGSTRLSLNKERRHFSQRRCRSRRERGTDPTRTSYRRVRARRRPCVCAPRRRPFSP